MKKTLKILAIIVIALFVLWCILCVILSMILKPSNLKRLVENASHHQVVIDGQLGLGFFPNLHLNASEITVKNPPGFGNKPFAHLYKASIALKLLPLLRKEIALGEISVNGVTLSLVKNADGVGNWQALAESFAKPSTVAIPTTQPSASSTPSVPWKIQLPAISMRGLNVDFTDLKTNAHWSIQNATLMTEKLVFHDALFLTLQFTLQSPNGTVLPLNFSGELASDFLHSFHLDHIMLTLGPSHIQGNIDYDQTQENFALNLSADELNMDRLFGNAPSSDDSDAPTSAPKAGTSAATANHVIHLPSLDGLQINAEVKIGRLIIHKVNLTNIQLTAKNQGDFQILIDPMTADFYQGKLMSTVLVNWQNMPYVKVDAKMDQANLQPLFTDLTQLNALKGTASFILHLQSPLAIGPDAMRAMTGNGNANVDNMAWQGVDFAYLYQNALSLIQHQTLSKFSNSGQTALGKVTVNYIIQNGFLNIQNFQTLSSVLSVNGKMKVDLITQNTDGVLNVTAMQGSQTAPQPLGPEIPFSISGNIKDPSIQPQLGGVLKNVIQSQLPTSPQDLLKKLKVF